MLVIRDLAVNENMDRDAMKEVRGGYVIFRDQTVLTPLDKDDYAGIITGETEVNGNPERLRSLGSPINYVDG